MVVIHHPEDLLAVDQLSPITATARAPRTRPSHEVLLLQEAVAEAVDHNEEEDSHVDPVEAAEAAGGEKGDEK